MLTLRTGYSLFDYAKPQSTLFQPSKTYTRLFRPPPQEPTPAGSTSGGATSMPNWSSSLTPAWNPSSRTPGYHSYFYFSSPSKLIKIIEL
jgi:hypothetical protein